MNRIVLSFVCALALVLIPTSYSWAQATTTQQDQVDRNGVNQTNQDVNRDSNLNQDTPNDSNKESDMNTREKPSSSESEQSTTPNQDQDQNQSQKQDQYQNPTKTESQTTTEPKKSYGAQGTTSSSSDRTSTNQAGESREGLPATAGELPLLALVGALLLAAGARFARAKSLR